MGNGSSEQKRLDLKPVTEQEAHTVLDKEINQQNNQAAKEFKQVVEKTKNTPTAGPTALSSLEGIVIDGTGYEVGLSGEVAMGVGRSVAAGMSVLWITDEDSPAFGGPYYYVYYGLQGWSIGFDVGVTVGEGVIGFLAWYDGPDKTIDVDSWTGIFYQLEIEGGVTLRYGVSGNFSYFSGSQVLSGVPSLITGEQVWRGVGAGVGVSAGIGGEISVSYGTPTYLTKESYAAAMEYVAGVDDRLADMIHETINRELREERVIDDEGNWNIRQIENYIMYGQ